MTITIDDTSPQIRYFPGPGSTVSKWTTDTRADAASADYFGQSFHLTTGDRDRMELKFNGTAVYVYGSKWFNHGLYSCQVDGGNTTTASGFSPPENRTTNALLCAGERLGTDGEHTLIVTNLPRQTPGVPVNTELFLDIDYVVINDPISRVASSAVIDDSSPAMRFSGPGWTHEDPGSAGSFKTTGSLSSMVGDTLTLPFTGSSIQLYGALNTRHGNYTVSIDGLEQPPMNATYHQLKIGVPLFTASNLLDGPHTLLLTNRGNPSGSTIEIDYAVVNSTADRSSVSPSDTSPGGVSTAIPNPNSPGSSAQGGTGNRQSSVDTGNLAGGIGGGLAAVAIIAAALIWWLRRRKRAREGEAFDPRMDLVGDEIKPFEYTPAPATLSRGAPGLASHGATSNPVVRDDAYMAYESVDAPHILPHHSSAPVPPIQPSYLPESSHSRSVTSTATAYATPAGPVFDLASSQSGTNTERTRPAAHAYSATAYSADPESPESPLTPLRSEMAPSEHTFGAGRHRSPAHDVPGQAVPASRDWPADAKHRYVPEQAMPRDSTPRPIESAAARQEPRRAERPGRSGEFQEGYGASRDPLDNALPPDYEQSVLSSRK